MKTEMQRALFALGILISLFPILEHGVMWFFVIYVAFASFPLLFSGGEFIEAARKFSCNVALPLGAGQLCVVGFIKGTDCLAGLLIFSAFIPLYMILLRMMFARIGGGYMPSINPAAYWKYYVRRKDQ